MHRAPAVRNVVNIQGIDADKSRALLMEQLRGRFGEIRVAFKILFRSPVSCSAGVHQNGLALYIRSLEQARPDGAHILRGMEYQAFKIRE